MPEKPSKKRAVSLPAIPKLAAGENLTWREAASKRVSQLLGSVRSKAGGHPFHASLVAGFCLILVVAGLFQLDPRIPRRLASVFFGDDALIRFDMWRRKDSALSYIIGLDGDDGLREPAARGPWEGVVESEAPAPIPPSLGEDQPEVDPPPRLKLIASLAGGVGYKGGGLGFGFAAWSRGKPLGEKEARERREPAAVGSSDETEEEAKVGRKIDRLLNLAGLRTGGYGAQEAKEADMRNADCPPGPRTAIPCLVRSKKDDGSERILVRWIPGAFHENSWQLSPDVIAALRDTSPYPEGYIDPEEETRPKPLPTVLTRDESDAMFTAITGLNPRGNIRAGTNPWDQLLRAEESSKGAMSCATCPPSARVNNDRGVYYGEKVE